MVKGVVVCSLDAFSTYQFSTVTQNAVHRVPSKKKRNSRACCYYICPPITCRCGTTPDGNKEEGEEGERER